MRNSRGNLRTVKTYTVILVYRRKLVTLGYTSFTLLLTDVLCVAFVYVFHLIKFVSFVATGLFLVNKDIHTRLIAGLFIQFRGC